MKLFNIILVLLMFCASKPVNAQNEPNFKVKDFYGSQDFEKVGSIDIPRQQMGRYPNCAYIKFEFYHGGDKGFNVKEKKGQVNRDGTTFSAWIPDGSEKLTITHDIHGNLTYPIPEKLAAGSPYLVVLEIKDRDLINKIDPDKYLYGNLEFNVMPFLGPALSIGYKLNHFSAELGFTYGFSKTDDVYFYGTGATILSAYNYQAMRLGLRFGYSIPFSNYIDLTPQVGAAYNIINGNEIKDVTITNSGYMDGFNTMSATLGLKLSFNFERHWGLSLTPEYDLGIYKDDNYDKIKEMNSKLKSWTDGFCLSAALKYKF